MPYLKVKTLENVNYRSLASFLLLGSLATFLPFFIHLPWITGPIINALLIILLFLSGRRQALAMAVIPSLMALAGGLLPVVLAPFVPFIMLSNIIFILVIDYVYQQGLNARAYMRATFLGSGTKFIFLIIMAQLLILVVDNQVVVKSLKVLFGVTQLISALLGSLLAFVVLRFLRRF